jgi:hypothetical protein
MHYFILFSVNEALRPKFLDLKEGAIVISLAPFVSSLNARVTERNVSMPCQLPFPGLTCTPLRSTISVQFLTSLNVTITLEAFPGGTVEVLTTSIAWIVKDTRRLGNDLKALEQARDEA